MLPAETTASASPSPTARHAATSELSGFARTASTGFSCIAISSGASTSSSPPVSRPRGPNSTGSIVLRAASSAPATISSGPRSPPMASTATRAGLSQGLRSRRSERLDLAPAVRLARRAHAVRLLRLVADRALVDAGRLQAMRRPPLVAARLRLSALRNCHDRPRSIARRPFLPRFQALPRLCLRIARAWQGFGDAGDMKSTALGRSETT